MKRKAGLSKERHFELGKLLWGMQKDLTGLLNEFYAAYSVNGREVKRLEKAIDNIELLRSVMDSAICRERPTTLSILRAYYPLQNQPDDTENHNDPI